MLFYKSMYNYRSQSQILSSCYLSEILSTMETTKTTAIIPIIAVINKVISLGFKYFYKVETTIDCNL